MKKMTLKAKRRLFILMSLSLVIFGYLSYNVICYASKINNSNYQKKELTSELDELTNKEKVLKNEVVKLEDPDYVAKFAREKYLYSKDGEIILRLIK